MRKILAVLLGFFIVTASATANAEENVTFGDAELEQILAPIALYPDSVLTHILIASTYPLEVVQAERWARKHADLPAGDAMKQIEEEDWDPSVKALIPFPKVLERMSDDLEWTQKSGDAFLQDESRVLDAIQSLRRKADNAGNLGQMDNVKIVREERVIVLEPAEPEVIYIPYYDTRVVYGPWYWDHYPPVYWHHHHHYSHHGGPFYWHPRVHISFGFFFSAFHWHNHHVVRIHHHHYNYRHHGHYRRHDIIRHTNVRRWQHNPTHRRGVAYRTHTVSQRYESKRPSRLETQNIRRTEREFSSRAENKRDKRITSQSSRDQANTERQVTRQERLRSQLNNREVNRTNHSRHNEQVELKKDRRNNRDSQTLRQNTNRELKERTSSNQQIREDNRSERDQIKQKHRNEVKRNDSRRKDVDKRTRAKKTDNRRDNQASILQDYKQPAKLEQRNTQTKAYRQTSDNVKREQSYSRKESHSERRSYNSNKSKRQSSKSERNNRSSKQRSQRN